jgi:hypothetical protein
MEKFRAAASDERASPVTALIDRNSTNLALEQLWSKRLFGDGALQACDF